MIAWIKILLKDFMIVIIHAGSKSERVSIGRGCRQGDPIVSLLFILCIEILLIKLRTSTLVKPFKIQYQKTPFKHETKEKHMEVFADDITLCLENSMVSLKDIINIVESFGDISGLRINAKKNQAMIFGHNSSTTKPAENTLGFEWVKKSQS